MRTKPPVLRVGAFATVLLLFAVPAEGAPNDPLDPSDCLYPLGPAAENGRYSVLSTGADPEWGITDTSFTGATKTYDTVVSIWGTLFVVYDGRFRLGDGGPGQQGGSKHNVLVKAWGPKGWNSTVEFPSNPDVKNATPEGNNLNPHAAAFNDRLWVAYSKESSFNYETAGVPIVMRPRDENGTWGPYVNVTVPAPESDNQIPKLLPVGDRLLIVWAHYDLVSHIGDTVVQGRFFDGTAFGPVFNISSSEDGLADNYPSVATDGVRVAVTWLATDLAAPLQSMAPKLAAFDGASWSAEVDLLTQNGAVSWGTSAAFFRGTLYVAFDTTDDRLNSQGDYGLFLREADPAALVLSEPRRMADSHARGDDYLPDLAVFGDRLHLVWVSSDDELGAGADLDLILRTFDGVAWSAPRDLTDRERYQDDEYVAKFLIHEGALFVYWITLVQPPGSTARDQRVATLLVERGPRWWDDVQASVEYGAPPQDGANVSARITFRNASGDPVESPRFSARLANGSWQRLEGGGGTYTLNFTYNATPVEPFKVLACGKPLPVEEVERNPPAGASVPSASPAMLLSGAAVAAALAGLAFVLVRRRRTEQA